MGDRAGQRLDNYQLIRLLGAGSFGEVYLAEHIHRKTQVAMKVLPQLADNDLPSFLNEARTIRLRHPHIVQVLDFGVDNHTPFIVMEYIPNGTLRQRYPKGTRLPLNSIAMYIGQVAQALQYAHDERMIHRDVKPENILLRSDTNVLLSDFGIATMARSTRSQSMQDMAGTVAYMAPEQVQGKPALASDQYALGIIAYEWLCGERPFNGSPTEIAMQHIVAPLPPLHEKIPTIAPQIEQVVTTALAKEPNKRFSSVQEFAIALEKACQPAPFIAPDPTFPAKPPIVSPPLPQQIQQPTPNIALQSSLKQPFAPPSEVATSRKFPILPQPISTENKEVISTSINIKIRQNRFFFPLLILLVLLVLGSIGSGTYYYFHSASGPTSSSSSGNGTTTGRTTGNGTTTGRTTGNGTTTGSTIIKIATDLPVSGNDESSGKPAENGAHLALDEANVNHAIPGYTLQFVPMNDVGPSGIHDPVVGQQNVEALIGDALVAGIVGPFNSNVARAEMPVANQAPIAMISPSNTNTCLTQNAPDTGCIGANDVLATVRPTGKVTYFRIATTDNHQGGVGADYLYKTLNYHSAYVIDDAETYGIGIANAFITEFQTDGGSLLGHSSEPGTTTSYLNLLTQIAAIHPSVIYFAGLDSTGGILVRQQMEQIPALKNTPYAGADGLQTSTFATTIGVNSGGPVYSTVSATDADIIPAAQAFITKYKSVYGAAQYGAYSAAGYDCMNIYIQAIKNALANGAVTPQNSNDSAGAIKFRQAVINAIQGISYNGVTGHQSFDSNGDTTDKVIAIYQLADVGGSPNWKFVTQQALS